MKIQENLNQYDLFELAVNESIIMRIFLTTFQLRGLKISNEDDLQIM